MNRIRGVQALAGFIFIAALLMLVGFDFAAYIKIFLGALLLAGAYGLLLLDRRRHRELSHSLLVQTINHHRHDWMNDFQVLLGLLKLKKYDSMQPYMDKIKAKLHQESCLSKLGVPSLIAYLMSFRTTARPFVLEVAVEQEMNLRQLPIDSEKVSKLLRNTVETFSQCAVPPDGEPNILSLELDKEDETLLLDFVYEGHYKKDKLQQALEKMEKDSKRWGSLEQHLGEEKAVLTLRLPLEEK
ncbi:Spo0B domain-containing protein [Paenibacillus senegalensis]|uniref:Spo0B domain-containing protein n=1 Tax=Paenibacillus senegalensis TaxID=1465766 RepID=UPI000288EAC4|nr:Spo0B domain-containing protein [Paenibacillus senegalensis]